MQIIEGGLERPEVVALLNEHLSQMVKHSPPGSVRALDLRGLQAPEITFWTVWRDSQLLGCGALKALDLRHGEIKSMRTAGRHLRTGVGARLLEHIIDESMRRGYLRLSLETGSSPAFAPAHALYRQFGFEYCGPFGQYPDDPFSRFMTRML